MSREKRRSRTAPGPSSSAGLLSFYSEVTESKAKIRPEFVMLLTISLIVGVVLANVFLRLP